MAKTKAKAVAGWYDHPDVPDKKRYWDGEAWTKRIEPMPGYFEETMIRLASRQAAAAEDAARSANAVRQMMILYFCLSIIGAFVLYAALK